MNTNKSKTYDVVGIGNALVDVLVHVEDEVLAQFDLQKTVMHSVTSEESKHILRELHGYDTKIVSGGGVANSLTGISSLGARTAFIGAVGSDRFARQFERDLEAYDVTPHVVESDEATGHAIIFITSDGERTFATHLGAAKTLSKDTIDEQLITSAKILYIEGYTLALAKPREAVLRAADIAREHDVLVAVDMSNVSIVREHNEHLRTLIEEYADIVLANADEARAYTGREKREALRTLAETTDIAVVTLHDSGSLIQAGEAVYEVAPVRAKKLVSTNGAGDMYAAGVLYGIVQGLPFEKVGELASFFAARAVEQDEARLPRDLVVSEVKKFL